MGKVVESITRRDYWRTTQYYRRLEKQVLATRRTKAARIAQVLSEGIRLNTARVLDIGCSIGLITGFLSEGASEVIGLDIDVEALGLSEKEVENNIAFVAGDATRLPFQDEMFDAVVCNQILEYISDKRLAIGEIRRVIRKKGVCYLAAINRMNPIDQYHGLPFLSWLPPRLADIYLRVSGRGDHYYESPMNYFQMKDLLVGFRMTDYTVTVFKNPATYGVTYETNKLAKVVLNALPSKLLRMLLILSPGWLILLEKI